MEKSLFNKLLFFWLVFHLVAYLSFKLKITPSFEETVNGEKTVNYILTPEYSSKVYLSTNILGVTTKMENMMFPSCENCSYNESDNFYPFHKFTYSVFNQYDSVNGFVGIFGYYGDYEFLLYFIIPLVLLILSKIYKKLFKS